MAIPVIEPGPLTYDLGALPTALLGPAYQFNLRMSQFNLRMSQKQPWAFCPAYKLNTNSVIMLKPYLISRFKCHIYRQSCFLQQKCIFRIRSDFLDNGKSTCLRTKVLNFLKSFVSHKFMSETVTCTLYLSLLQPSRHRTLE